MSLTSINAFQLPAARLCRLNKSEQPKFTAATTLNHTNANVWFGGKLFSIEISKHLVSLAIINIVWIIYCGFGNTTKLEIMVHYGINICNAM